MQSLLENVRATLRHLQHTLEEELIISNNQIFGKIDVNLLANYYPSSIPIRIQKITIDTPANIFLVYKIYQIQKSLLEARHSLTKGDHSYVMSILVEEIINEIDKAYALCTYILDEPILKTLIKHIKTHSQKEIEKLEKKIRIDITEKPREYRTYKRIFQLLKKINDNIVIVRDTCKNPKFRKTLTLNINPEKLYELYGFTLILQQITEIYNIDSQWNIEIDREGKILTLTKNNTEITISYNSLPRNIQSFMTKAIGKGIINGPLDTQRLRGLPDTIILIKKNNTTKKIIIDYKYTTDIRYIVESRFKALAYLYEYNADTTIIISPPPKQETTTEEETEQQKTFYYKAKQHKGAIIHITHNNQKTKTIALAYIDPTPQQTNQNKKTIKTLLKITTQDLEN
ncbi:MAG: hypothetical protein J7K83_01485 [Candidatus Aenigmarchaeota archaeon]|nr:hypothetical protein [Candidatus Aenigmarchaeota archaeon]